MDWVKQLEGLYLRGQVLLSEPLRRYTSMGVGGAARALVFPADARELARLLQFARRQGVRFCVLGAGSNLLVRDGGFDGMVINLCMGFRRISHRENLLQAQAGVLVSKLSAYARENGLAGLEFLSGVPGTVGGVVVMNAGAAGEQVDRLLVRVLLMRLDGDQQWLERSQIEFGYRSSSLAGSGVVLEAHFALQQGEGADIESRMQQVLSRRKACQPTGASAGSVFKNPPGDYAGRLIEEVGLKGFCIGNAQISEQHANFIINRGGASARDVESLIQLAQREVMDKKGVWLEPEVKIVGQSKKTGD